MFEIAQNFTWRAHWMERELYRDRLQVSEKKQQRRMRTASHDVRQPDLCFNLSNGSQLKEEPIRKESV